jgi:16S rRNA (guanine966-N2)-methyltransferase
MRIIAGQRRGHKIDGPTVKATRPTSDLVRESIFNILGSQIEGALAIDLFAGTGALGLEALSRGARRAVFVEIHRENLGVIRRNLAALRYEDRGQIVGSDVYRWARGFDLATDVPVIVFVDPPYREYDNHPGRIADLIAFLTTKLPTGSTVVVQASKHSDERILPDLERWDRRRYGNTVIAIRRLIPEPPELARDEPTADPD